MTTDDNLPPKNVLRRWSQRKLEAARGAPDAPPPAVAPAVPANAPARPATAAPGPAPAPDEVALPSIESLSFESDFAAFLRPQVDEVLKQQALKKLFSDARFNVMDGLDIYIDDYTKADPISPEMVRELVQGRGIFGLHDAKPVDVDPPIAGGLPDDTMAAVSAPAPPMELPPSAPQAPVDGAESSSTVDAGTVAEASATGKLPRAADA